MKITIWLEFGWANLYELQQNIYLDRFQLLVS